MKKKVTKLIAVMLSALMVFAAVPTADPVARAADTQDEAVALSTAKEDLSALYELWKDDNLSKYTPESAAAMQQALDDVRAVLEDEDATELEILTVTMELRSAIRNLAFPVSTIYLEIAVEAGEEILAMSRNYVDVSGLYEAVENGRAVLAQTDITDDDVDAAAARILYEMELLVKDADVDALERIIAAAKNLLNQDYTTDTRQELEDAIAAAQDAIADQERGEDVIADAYTALIESILGLQMRGDKAALAAMLDRAEQVLQNRDRYLETTLEGLEDAVAAARSVYEDGNAVQSVINDAVVTLTTQLAGARLVGDVNGDGEITTSDAVLLLQYLAEMTTISPIAEASADVNGDGRVDSSDAVLILQYTAEVIAAF